MGGGSALIECATKKMFWELMISALQGMEREPLLPTTTFDFDGNKLCFIAFLPGRTSASNIPSETRRPKYLPGRPQLHPPTTRIEA